MAKARKKARKTVETPAKKTATTAKLKGRKVAKAKSKSGRAKPRSKAPSPARATVTDAIGLHNRMAGVTPSKIERFCVGTLDATLSPCI